MPKYGLLLSGFDLKCGHKKCFVAGRGNQTIPTEAVLMKDFILV